MTSRDIKVRRGGEGAVLNFEEEFTWSNIRRLKVEEFDDEQGADKEHRAERCYILRTISFLVGKK